MKTDDMCSNCVDIRACKSGTTGVVTCVRRTADNGSIVRRLAELGIRSGANIVAGQRTPGGGRVVAVAGSHLALDAETLGCLHVVA